MLNSDDLETRKLAYLGLKGLPAEQIGFAHEAIERGLHSSDRDEAARALDQLSHVPSKQRGFALDGLIAAAISHLGDPDDSWMNERLKNVLRNAARDLPDFPDRLKAFTPADASEQRQRAAIMQLLNL
jgi:hypothetical protein